MPLGGRGGFPSREKEEGSAWGESKGSEGQRVGEELGQAEVSLTRACGSVVQSALSPVRTDSEAHSVLLGSITRF